MQCITIPARQETLIKQWRARKQWLAEQHKKYWHHAHIGYSVLPDKETINGKNIPEEIELLPPSVDIYIKRSLGHG